MKFILGFIMIIVGALMVAKVNSFLSFFGRIEFFEAKLGTSGGSRLGYQLIGIALIFFGILIVTGLIGGFLEWALGPLLKYGNAM